MNSQILFNILLSFSVYLLLSASFGVIYSTLRFFHFAFAGIITFGPYACYFFLYRLNFPLFLSIPFAVLSSIAIIILVDCLIFRYLRKRGSSSVSMLVASLGTYLIIQNLISMNWGDGITTLSKAGVSTGMEFSGAYVTNIQIITFLMSLALYVGLLLFLKFSTIGIQIRAVSSNMELAEIVGIKGERIVLWALCLGAFMASVCGILLAFDTGATPTFGFNLFLYAVVAMIIGGIGSQLGLIAGSLMLSVFQHTTSYFISSEWMDAITYTLLVAFIIYKPLGFSGKRLKKVEI